MQKVKSSLATRLCRAAGALLVGGAVGFVIAQPAASAAAPIWTALPPAGPPQVVEISGSVAPAGDPAPGDRVTFTVELTNPWMVPAVGWTLIVPIPAGYVDVSWTCTAEGDGSACETFSDNGTIDQTVDVGPNGGVVTVVISGLIDPVAPVPFEFAATLVPPLEGGVCGPPPGEKFYWSKWKKKGPIEPGPVVPCAWEHEVNPTVPSTPSPTPEPTPTPGPSPTPGPTPGPEPTPTPGPTLGPTPTPEPTPEPTEPPATAPPGSPPVPAPPFVPSGGGLPVTGSATAALAMAGVGSMFAGSGLLWYAGRRRMRRTLSTRR